MGHTCVSVAGACARTAVATLSSRPCSRTCAPQWRSRARRSSGRCCPRSPSRPSTRPSKSQTTSSTVWHRQYGRATSRPRTAWPAPSGPAPCTSTATTLTTSPCRLAASSSRAWDATSPCTHWRSTPSSRPPGSTCREGAAATAGRVSAALRFLASAPRGFADLLVRELQACGAVDVRERAGGVAFGHTLESAYRACLWSRIANRIYLEVAQFVARDTAEFYAGVLRTDWTAHLAPGATLACEFSGRHPAIDNTHFGALKLKDGIVDALRAATGARPDIILERPDVRVHAHAHGTEVTVSLDLSGESLHRRGYRGAAGEAPLKENVAAGVLMRSQWPELAAQGAELLDPLCGSGTFCIEAALMAADRAPGLTREYFGFLGWRGHDPQLWARLLAEARTRATAGEATGVTLRGQDRDASAIRSARENAARAGVERWVSFQVGELVDAAPLPERPADRPGLLCTNPPYGVRLENDEGARQVHRELGTVLRERFQGWNAAVLTGA